MEQADENTSPKSRLSSASMDYSSRDAESLDDEQDSPALQQRIKRQSRRLVESDDEGTVDGSASSGHGTPSTVVAKILVPDTSVADIMDSSGETGRDLHSPVDLATGRVTDPSLGVQSNSGNSKSDDKSNFEDVSFSQLFAMDRVRETFRFSKLSTYSRIRIPLFRLLHDCAKGKGLRLLKLRIAPYLW